MINKDQDNFVLFVVHILTKKRKDSAVILILPMKKISIKIKNILLSEVTSQTQQQTYNLDTKQDFRFPVPFNIKNHKPFFSMVPLFLSDSSNEACTAFIHRRENESGE